MDLKSHKRVVIKVGSTTIVDDRGKINSSWLKSLSSDVAKLKKFGLEVIIVTSGAVALGRSKFNFGDKKLNIEEKQAAFACGQVDLMLGYIKSFKSFKVAQILLTINDTEKRQNYLNAKNAIEELLSHNIIPVINENDVVATAELKYGDNDRLSARVAQMLGADLLILLSDVDGLYTANPNIDKKAKHIRQVDKITKDIEAIAGDTISGKGSGGMKTKIDAAKIATNAGCSCVITLGSKNAVSKIFDGKQPYTIFTAKTNPLNARKAWIMGGVNPMGEIMIDDGAVKALLKGSSLLPAGATEIKGEFERGDLVIVKSKNGEVARGLVAYSSDDAKHIIRKKSSEIEKILGYADRSELIHRDDLVITAE